MIRDFADMGQSERLQIVVNKHTPYVVQAFEQLGEVKAFDTREITRETVHDADILIVRSETKVDQSLVEGSKVKFVGTVTIGTDHVDEEYLEKHGITFVSAPGCNANSVSEYITAALLELAHKKGIDLQGKTLGIVGVGNVGSKVWRKAEVLGLRVLLNDPPLQRQGKAYPFHSLEELMEADFITLHVPLIRKGEDATYHLFNEERIRKMKRGAVLINSSRGAVIETEALKRTLSDGHLSAAILDVWEKEPTINLSLLDKVYLGTQHIAGHSLDGKVNALRMNYEAVCHFLSQSPDRDIHALVPDPGLPEIKVDNIQGSIQESLRTIVKNCYDINEDDRLLRQIHAIPAEEQGRFFSRLRTGYRTRREFFNYTVCVGKNAESLINTLKLLGFQVKKAFE